MFAGTGQPQRMSHSHTHGPGEVHSHSHMHLNSPQTPQSPGFFPPDPVLQALIDQDFVPVPIALSSDSISVLCPDHKREKCDDCSVDFSITNRLSKLLAANPNLLCPPPSNVVSQKLSQMVTSIKEDGNVGIQTEYFRTDFTFRTYRRYLKLV